jgi:ATP-binding cassette subfamily F protein 3
MESYRRLLSDRGRKETSGGRQREERANKPATNKKAQRQAKARRRQETAELRQSARQAEDALGRLSSEMAALESKLADPALYDETPEALATLQVRHTALKAAVAEAEDRWLRAHDTFEAAQAQKS